jgi:hypothetical protein
VWKKEVTKWSVFLKKEKKTKTTLCIRLRKKTECVFTHFVSTSSRLWFRHATVDQNTMSDFLDMLYSIQAEPKIERTVRTVTHRDITLWLKHTGGLVDVAYTALTPHEQSVILNDIQNDHDYIVPRAVAALYAPRRSLYQQQMRRKRIEVEMQHDDAVHGASPCVSLSSSSKDHVSDTKKKTNDSR